MTGDKNALMVKCGACQHSWKACTLPLPLQRVATLLKGLFCPECGADSKQIFVEAGKKD
jgi:hypothetical protein